MSKLHLAFNFTLAGVCAAALAGCSGNGTNNSDGGPGGDGGTGMYTRRTDLVVGALPQSMAVTDINHDSKPDVLVACATGNGALSLISTNTAGMVQATLLSNSIGDTPYGLAVGDFDGDGSVDAAVPNFLGGDVTVLFGPDFVTKVSLGDGAHPIAIAVGDVNSDSKPDVLTSNQVNNSVGVTLNMGSRKFATRTDTAVGAPPGVLLLGATDSTRPSRLDVVITVPGQNKLRIFTGQGGGTFSTTQFSDVAVGQAPSALAMADLNGDGNPDLVATNRLDNTVSVLLGQSGGTFAPAVTYPVGNQPQGVAIGDIDVDGKLDVVVSNNSDGTVSILRGQGGGQLKLTDTVTVGKQPLPVAITDIDGDGVVDILVGNNGDNTVTVLFGKKV